MVGQKGIFQMGLKDTVEMARQMKQLKKRELEAEGVERRGPKRRHKEEEFKRVNESG